MAGGYTLSAITADLTVQVTAEIKLVGADQTFTRDATDKPRSLLRVQNGQRQEGLREA